MPLKNQSAVKNTRDFDRTFYSFFTISRFIIHA